MQAVFIVAAVIAGIIVLAALSLLIAALATVKSVFGRRKSFADDIGVKTENGIDRFGCDAAWFDTVKANTESLTITAFDGIKLSSLLIKNAQKTNRVAICCHGYGVSPRTMQVQAKLFYERGFDVLLPYMRGHGASEGRVGMAWLDRFDLLRWTDAVVDTYGPSVQIAYAGTSMGGATVVAASGMNPPRQVKCVIDDCGFSSQREQCAQSIKKAKLPVKLTMFVLDLGMRLVHNYSMHDADITPLAASMTAPALFIHGDDDKVVAPEYGQKLFDACGSADKTFKLFAGAGHALSYVTDPDGYTDCVGGFIEKVFSLPPLPVENKVDRAPDAESETAEA